MDNELEGKIEAAIKNGINNLEVKPEDRESSWKVGETRSADGRTEDIIVTVTKERY